MDGRLRHWFYTRWSLVGYLRKKMVLDHTQTSKASLIAYRFFIAASVLGLIGTIIGASAQSINMLIVRHVCQHVIELTDNLGHKLHQRSRCSWTIVLPHQSRRTCTELRQRSRQRVRTFDFDPLRRVWPTCCTSAIFEHRTPMAMVLHSWRHREQSCYRALLLLLPSSDICKQPNQDLTCNLG
jgi:hypothetical protein